MSDEYSIRLGAGACNADGVMAGLGESPLRVDEKNAGIARGLAVKDPASRNTWTHDLRVFKVDDKTLLLEITNATDALYRLFKSALPSGYRLTEADDAETLTLEEVFRIG